MSEAIYVCVIDDDIYLMGYYDVEDYAWNMRDSMDLAIGLIGRHNSHMLLEIPRFSFIVSFLVVVRGRTYCCSGGPYRFWGTRTKLCPAEQNLDAFASSAVRSAPLDGRGD
jgi:hypothetical protein